MFYLPLYVNHRRYHYCRLLPDNSTALTEPFHFIVEHHPGFRPVLIRLTDGLQFLSGKGSDYDLPVDNRRIKPSCTFDPDTHIFTLDLSVGEPERRNNITALNEGLEKAPFLWQESDGHWVLRYTGPDKATTYAFRVRLHQEGETFSGYIYLHLGKSEQIFDAVFDFGSEASQIACKQRSQEARRDQRFNMLDRLVFDFYAPAVNEGNLRRKAVAGQEGQVTPWNVQFDRYYQYDADDDKLFRSSFLVRRTYPLSNGMEEALSIAPFSEGDLEWVSILGDTYDPRIFDPKQGDSYELIPNLKLAELGFIKDFKLQLGDRLAHFSDATVHEAVFRRLMNEFLHLLLSELESNHPEERNKLVRLTLLVPNIYSQRRIFKLLENLQLDFARIRSRYPYGVSGIEVQTLSESDASFLGLLSDPSVEGMNVHQLKAGENYLIVDVGKGTTDLSIIQVGEERDQFSSIFRSGFAGAGNAVTFAFVETIAAAVAVFHPETGREDILKRILNAEIQQKLELMKWTEKLKRQYKIERPYMFGDLDFLKDLDPAAPSFMAELNRVIEVEFIRKNRTIEDYFGFVEHSVTQIIKKTTALIRRSGVEKFPVIVLSGRGFLMNSLRTEMEKTLQEEFQIGRFVIEEKKLKTSCLYGPLNFPAGTNKNSDLIGTPVVSEKSGLPSIRSLLFRRRERPKDRTYSDTDLNADDFYLEGQAMDLSNQRITVCGRELLLPGTLMSEGDDEINLIFTGHAFLARTPKGALELQFGHEGHDNPLSDELAWKSLFPYVSGNVPLSPATKRPDRSKRQSSSQIADSANLENQPDPSGTSTNVPNQETPVTQTDASGDDMWDYL